jgi:hypothetical protein
MIMGQRASNPEDGKRFDAAEINIRTATLLTYDTAEPWVEIGRPAGSGPPGLLALDMQMRYRMTGTAPSIVSKPRGWPRKQPLRDQAKKFDAARQVLNAIHIPLHGRRIGFLDSNKRIDQRGSIYFRLGMSGPSRS